ncbi:MAG: hypothetical protein ABFC34_13115 [Methanobacterium sp.]
MTKFDEEKEKIMYIGCEYQSYADELFTLLNDNGYHFINSDSAHTNYWDVNKSETVYAIYFKYQEIAFTTRDWIWENTDNYKIYGFYAGMAKLNELFKK